MMTNRSGMLLLALGLAVGGTVTSILKPPAAAFAASPSPAMSGTSAPLEGGAGDEQMMAAMNRMMTKMSGLTPTGVQDEDFMTMMIPHHESAVDMAKIELKLGTHPALKSLARDIIASQGKEIAQMDVWLMKWYGKK